ncbi:MAG: imidazole glycerol phosphate synthase subunit HisH [Bacteroidaceae bacterium]|nr:imidazole glycerol phosphate synthase subunit HisH [Bacteroidaceae bacterium]
MKIAVLQYNAGNTYSVVNALCRLGVNPVLTDDIELLGDADKVIVPGQGAASQAMQYLRDHRLDQLLVTLRQPVLGICIGQQLFCQHSDEGNVDCLQLIDAPVHKFVPTHPDQKIPHMGWNSLHNVQGPLFDGIHEGDFVYFVHSYFVPQCPYTIATCDYIHPFSAALQKDNFYATQFHPEKSGKVGERILKNFLDL